MKHLVFQLYAPLAAFGSAGAKKEIRTVENRPTASGMVGLIGAALGKKREDPWHAEMAKASKFSFVILRPGTPLRDYHTIATAPGIKKSFSSRREELEASTYTVQTERDYLSDFYAIVALWADPNGKGFEMEEIVRGLKSPIFELFAGRKACPLGLPTAPILTDVPKLSSAFRAYLSSLYPALFEDGPKSVFWDEHPDPGLVAIERLERDDSLVDRARRLWRTRRELHGEITLSKKEVP